MVVRVHRSDGPPLGFFRSLELLDLGFRLFREMEVDQRPVPLIDHHQAEAFGDEAEKVRAARDLDQRDEPFVEGRVA